jgi:hypothetical protein
VLYTTFNKLHEFNACTEGYQKLARSLGGVNKYGKNTPIPLDKIIESNGLADTIWTLRATTESAENLLIEFACRCAEHTLHFFEDKYPEDKRPRLAIEAARRCITDKTPAARAAAWAAARSAAESAAWSPAWAAAWAAWAAAWAATRAAARDAGAAAWDAARAAWDAWAARDAAGAAAWAAEEKWQTKQLLELLRK